MSRRMVFVLAAVAILITALYWSTAYRESEEAGPPYRLKGGGEASGRSGDIELKLRVEVFQENDYDKLRCILTLINHGKHIYSRLYWAGDLDIKVYSKGRWIGNFKRGGIRPDLKFPVYIKPGKEYTRIEEWHFWITDPSGAYNPKFIKPGKYQLSGIWRADPWIETSRIPIEIRPK